jgi:hypothetical protein
MKIISVKTEVLLNSIKMNEAKTEADFQANAWIAVEGNPYIEKDGVIDLATPKTVFGLKCPANQLANIEQIAEAQVATWVEENYPETE